MERKWRAIDESLRDKKHYLDDDVFDEMQEIIKDQLKKENDKNLTKLGDNIKKIVSRGIPKESIQNAVLAQYNNQKGLI